MVLLEAGLIWFLATTQHSVAQAVGATIQSYGKLAVPTVLMTPAPPDAKPDPLAYAATMKPYAGAIVALAAVTVFLSAWAELRR